MALHMLCAQVNTETERRTLGDTVLLEPFDSFNCMFEERLSQRKPPSAYGTTSLGLSGALLKGGWKSDSTPNLTKSLRQLVLLLRADFVFAKEPSLHSEARNLLEICARGGLAIKAIRGPLQKVLGLELVWEVRRGGFSPSKVPNAKPLDFTLVSARPLTSSPTCFRHAAHIDKSALHPKSVDVVLLWLSPCW